SGFGAITPATGRKILVAAHSRLPSTTKIAAQPGTGIERELMAMKAAIGIRLAPAQNKRLAGICVNPAIGVDASKSRAPIAAHVTASSVSRGFNEESLLLFVMLFLLRG